MPKTGYIISLFKKSASLIRSAFPNFVTFSISYQMPKETQSRDPAAHAAHQAQIANAALEKKKDELEMKNQNLQQQLHELLQSVDPQKR